jgi:hypothetical protein
MPPLPPVPLVMAIRLIQTDGADTNVQNTFHYSYTNAVSAADASTLATSIASSWTSNIAPLVVTGFSLESVIVNDLNSTTGVQVAVAVSTPGTNAGVHLTSAVAFVVSSKTSLKYRGGHGRAYLTGFPQADLQNDNTWLPATVTNVTNAWHNLVFNNAATAPVGMGTCTPVVVHRYSSNPHDFSPAPPSTPPPWPLANPQSHIVTSMVGNPKVASQRRRNQQP